MRRRISTLVLATLAATAALALAQQEQPAAQPQVTQHWSPYEYPTAFPPGARVYIIVSGDTLWDIAERTYNNPLLWPQIYSANSYIGNPHWIYPGDPLVLPPLAVAEPGMVAQQPTTPAGERPAAPAEPTGEPSEEPAGEPSRPTPEPAPAFQEGVIFETEPRPSLQYQPAVTEVDLYCSSVVYPSRLDTGFWVAEREFDGQIDIADGDIIYINVGKDFLEVGDTFIAANEQGPVKHPHTGKLVGIAYQEVGQVRVIIAAEDIAVAEVTTACDGLAVGSTLIPYVPRPNPITPVRETMPVLEQYQESGEAPVGCIIRANYESQEMAAGDVINIDLGALDGLKVGDRCYITKDKPVPLTMRGRRSADPTADGAAGIQRVVAEAIVYFVLENTSCARITYSVDFPLIGYYVIPIPRR